MTAVAGQPVDRVDERGDRAVALAGELVPLAVDEQQLGARIAQAIFELGARPPGVERHADRADRHRGEERHRGDRGETGLGDGRRVPKDHPRIEAIGEVDSLNSQLGLLLAGLAGYLAVRLGALNSEVARLSMAQADLKDALEAVDAQLSAAASAQPPAAAVSGGSSQLTWSPPPWRP